jgi:hypothetical protein
MRATPPQRGLALGMSAEILPCSKEDQGMKELFITFQNFSQ